MIKKYVNALQKIKADKKISMYDLALDVGVSYTVIRNFLKGKVNLRLENFKKIYDYIQNN